MKEPWLRSVKEVFAVDQESGVSVEVSISDLVGRLGQRNASDRASRKDYR